MNLHFLVLDTIPNSLILEGILRLSDVIFNNVDTFNDRINDKPKILFNIALDGPKVIGFKIGYELDKNKFYSWLGGVDANYRKHGIASKLMIQQHQYIKRPWIYSGPNENNE